MNEPANHAAVVDQSGDTWVRCDDMPGQYGTWWPITDGPGWEPWGRDKVGQSRTWDMVEEHGPFTPADEDRTARAIDMVRAATTR